MLSWPPLKRAALPIDRLSNAIKWPWGNGASIFRTTAPKKRPNRSSTPFLPRAQSDNYSPSRQYLGMRTATSMPGDAPDRSGAYQNAVDHQQFAAYRFCTARPSALGPYALAIDAHELRWATAIRA